MPAVRCLVADGNHDARWLAGFEYDDDCVRLRTLEVGVNELVTTALRGIHHRDFCVFRPAFQPLLEMVSDTLEQLPRDWIESPIGVEEANDPFRLLERLDQPVEQDPVEAAIVPANAIPVMFVECVHGRPPAEASPAG